ncbi:MAG: AAA family ATPase [Lachnospiraceae bacterium]|nr:AAA family ATPase [Lachnospiraceae bacterium]
MRLLSVHIENFGKLHDYDRDFTSGINTVTEENGWGKSTLSAFLLVMFYGFDDKSVKKLREKYAPWNGGVFGGSVIFETEGKHYVIERTFGHKKTLEDTFVLRDAETNLVSDDFDEYLGDELFKINTESFLKTVFMGQNGCVTETTDDINAKIGDLSMVDSDMRSYSEAQRSLTDYINKNSDTRKTGKIYALKERLTDLRNKARFSTGIKNELSDCDNSLASLSKEGEELENEKSEITVLQTRIVKCKEAVLSNEKYKVLLSGMDAAEKAKNEPFKESMAPGITLYASGIVLFIGGIAVAFLESMLFGGLAGGVGLLLLAAGMTITFKREKRRAAREKAGEDAYEQAEHEFLNFVNSIDMNEVRELASQPEATLSLKETDKKRTEITERLDRIRKELQKLETRREFLCEELTSCETAETKANELAVIIDESILKLENAKRAEKLLEEAKVNFALRYLEPLRKSLCDYYAFLKGGEGSECCLDANLTLTVTEAGKQRPEDAFSDGIRDALGLCMRFALIDAMYPTESPFVIMDDPFLHFDSATKEAAMRLLNKVPYQIILMQKK